MPDISANLSLPLLMAAQAQKHVTHNEALLVLDALVQLTVADRTRTVPPVTSSEGDRHIVANGAAGEWAGAAGALATYQNGAWVFRQPQPGWRAFVLAENRDVIWRDDDWRDGGDLDLVAATVGVNTTADAVNRLSVSAPATLLNHAGAGHQLKINKAGAADTASLLFQSGFSGRAEMGLAGNADFSVKVSADGSAFLTALTAAAADGAVSLPQGARLPEGTSASPALRFETDPDTGLTHPAANQLGFVTGGTQRASLSTSALNVSVPITGSAVTQSAGDTTAGRLLKVGATTTGGQSEGSPAPGNDLNAARTFGVFDILPDTANRPPAFTNGTCLVVPRNDGRVAQIATLLEGQVEPAIFTRVSSGVSPFVWGAWRSIYTAANVIGAVSQSGGIPTGAVIEAGNNANGRYRRFACGLQLCWSTALTAATTNVADGALYRSNNTPWTFPVAFLTASVPVVTPGHCSDADVWVTPQTPSATVVSARLKSTTSKGAAISFGLLATGYWY